MKVGIVSNSPGEVAGWAIPASSILKKIGSKVDLYLTPCVFSTKKEYEVALKYGNFNTIFPPAQTIQKIFFKAPKYDIFFHMGGEIWYSTRFRTKKLFSYGWGTKSLDKYFEAYLVPNQYYYRKLLDRNISSGKIIKIKDLTFEKLKPQEYNINSNLIGFMLGSREVEFWGLLEIYLDAIKFIDHQYTFIFFVSPFIYHLFKDYEDFMSKVNYFVSKKTGKYFEGLRFVIEEGEKIDLLPKLKLLVTIPGTKTNEAGYLGIPQLVILPVQKPEYIPIWGLGGWLDFLGKIGKKIKGYIVSKYIKDKILTGKRFIAMPNIIANQAIIPEYVGNIQGYDLANKLNQILANHSFLMDVSKKLRSIYEEWEKQSISFEEFTRTILS